MRVMSKAESQRQPDSMVEMPMSFLREEKRLAGRAMQAWRRSQRASVPGFEATSLTIADPGGAALLRSVAPAIAATFGLSVGQSLAAGARDTESEIAAELRAACDLVALGGRPVPFEASLIAPDRTIVLMRGCRCSGQAMTSKPRRSSSAGARSSTARPASACAANSAKPCAPSEHPPQPPATPSPSAQKPTAIRRCYKENVKTLQDSKVTSKPCSCHPTGA